MCQLDDCKLNNWFLKQLKSGAWLKSLRVPLKKQSNFLTNSLGYTSVEVTGVRRAASLAHLLQEQSKAAAPLC